MRLALIILVLSFSTAVMSQQSVNASGGDAVGTNGSVSYSIGQAFVQTNSEATGSVAEGIQQAFEISVITKLEEKSDVAHVNVSAYPNPVADNLQIKVDGELNETISYELFNEVGMEINKKELTNSQSLVDMKHLAPGIYFLNVSTSTNIIEKFKIVKY